MVNNSNTNKNTHSSITTGTYGSAHGFDVSSILTSSNISTSAITESVFDSTSVVTKHYMDLHKEIQDIKQMLMMINRDFYLEEKYPKLKEKADEYHKQLEKYKTFERLKGNDK